MTDPAAVLPAVTPGTTVVLRRGRAEEENLPPHLRGLVTYLLRIGVSAAAILMLVGMLLLTVHPLTATVRVRPDPGSLGSGFITGDPATYLYAGILLLLATPLVRVGLSAGLFARAGDRDFAGIALLVLSLLAVSIVVGLVL